MNLVRCKYPDGSVKRFPSMTVSDYRDLLMIRADMEHRKEDEQRAIIEEVMERHLPDVPKNYRPYVFCSIYLSSLGNTYIPLVVECPICKREIKINVNFEPKGISDIEVTTKYGIKLKIKYPEDDSNIVEHIQNNITHVEDSNKIYTWEELSNEEKIAVIGAIDIDVMNDILNKSNPVFKHISLKCCGNPIDIEIKDMLTLFKLFIHKDEINNFYMINHRMSTMNYDIKSIMSMIPMERTIYLALIERDLKEARNK